MYNVYTHWALKGQPDEFKPNNYMRIEQTFLTQLFTQSIDSYDFIVSGIMNILWLIRRFTLNGVHCSRRAGAKSAPRLFRLDSMAVPVTSCLPDESGRWIRRKLTIIWIYDAR